MERPGSATGSGLGLFGATFLVLLVLKITKLVGMSWWVVTLPLWGPAALLTAVLVVWFLVFVLRKPKKERNPC